MQIQHIGYRIRGFYRVAGLGHRWGMMTQDTQQRLKILDFWSKHGTRAACEAFGVSRRTLYRWRKALRESNDRPAALAPRSSAPKHRRQPMWPDSLAHEIRRLRRVHPNMGKQPLSVLLRPWCGQRQMPTPSASTTGRIIARASDKMRCCPVWLDARGRRKPLRRVNKPRRPKGQTTSPMELFACDTVERMHNGIRRYVFTFIDPCSRIAFAWASTTRSSRRAAHALRLLNHFTPTTVRYVLSDNGSEFMKDFESQLQQQQTTHWWTYPKCPKMNAHCERFNRTIQESFIDYHEDLLFTDVDAFNRAMAEWLVFYNTERPHHSLSLLSPIQWLLTNHPECQRWWTRTGGGLVHWEHV